MGKGTKTGKKIGKAFLIFWGLMFLGYLISRGIYASGLPKVTVENAESRTIFHTVEASGILQQDADTGIYVPSGLAVKEVKVHPGDSVEKGDELFTLEVPFLQQVVEEKEVELKKLEVQLETVNQNRSMEEQDRQTSLQRLEKQKDDYQNWKQTLEQAEKNLEQWNQQVKLLTEQLNALQNADSVSGGDVLGAKEKEEELNRATQAQNMAELQVQKLLSSAVTDPGYDLEDAARPLNADSTGKVLQLERQKLQEEMDSYLLLVQKEGKVCADQSGRIYGISVQAGGLTPAQASVTISSDDSPVFLETVFDKEQVRYLSQNMDVTVKLNAGTTYQKTLDNLTESSIGDGSFIGRVVMETGEGVNGENGIVRAVFQSEQYDCCFSIDALYQDSNNRYFVYLLEESQGFFGTELIVRKQYVTLLDSNESYAAVEPQTLDADSRLVVHTTKILTDGGIVRLE